MATPILTGELIGQQITINCDEQIDDFYRGQLSINLSTEYDLTKGIDITFDGQLYKNVSVRYEESIGFVIGEVSEELRPIFTTYPFCIILVLDK